MSQKRLYNCIEIEKLTNYAGQNSVCGIMMSFVLAN